MQYLCHDTIKPMEEAIENRWRFSEMTDGNILLPREYRGSFPAMLPNLLLLLI